MKSPLRMFRGLKFYKDDGKQAKKPHHVPAKMDELVQATLDMQDMRNCYDSILSAAATTANNSHEFSEALEELGTCLLEKTVLSDDEDRVKALMMMGKAQFELQKLFDNYRTHVLRTMDKPSRSLLRELEIVEEMKHSCDAKRERYKNMLAVHRGKGCSRQPKSVILKELQEAQASYEEEAAVFVFRLKSLKKGQFQSLLTQATRHHAAQLSFFRKGLKTLEMVESHVKAVAERDHIVYEFSDLEDDGSDCEDEDGCYYDDSDDGALSFEYEKNFQEQKFVYFSKISLQESTDKCKLDTLNFSLKPVHISSQSAPIFADKKLDSAEKTETLPASTRKFHSYVLPKPADDRRPNSGPGTAPHRETKNRQSPPLWHSSPLDAQDPVKDFKESGLSSPTKLSKNSALRENKNYSGPIKMPSFSYEKPSVPKNARQTVYDANFLKRQAFSGPLASKPFSSKPIFTTPDYGRKMELPSAVTWGSRHASKPQSTLAPTVAPRTSSPLSAPKINELHELPRPPAGSDKTLEPSSLIGYSGPLISRHQVFAARSNVPSGGKTQPLPMPLGHISRSFSIPTNSQRMPMITVAQLLESPRNPVRIEEITSPPCTPLPVMTTPLPLCTTTS